jgi:hypothetical protein
MQALPASQDRTWQGGPTIDEPLGRIRTCRRVDHKRVAVNSVDSLIKCFKDSQLRFFVDLFLLTQHRSTFKMFAFNSSPRSSISIEIEKDMYSYNSSPRSSLSIEATKSTDKIFSTIEIVPSPSDSTPEPREGLRKRVRHHFRSFCRHKSPNAISVSSIHEHNRSK